MEPKVKIVVGANYGDEGKGLVTARLAQEAQPGNILNVLYNGGPQRGHTVEYSNGFRHIFHHFGSGFLEGAQTYFDEDFMVNPLIFNSELHELHMEAKRKEYNFWPQYEKASGCYISPKCRVITPWDSFANILIEESRDEESKHGSCGLGIWETYQRYSYAPKECRYSYGKLTRMSNKELREYFNNVRHYEEDILHHYGVTDFGHLQEVFYSQNLIEKMITELRRMSQWCVNVIDFPSLASLFDTVIFEGGQGLALDEDNDDALPYVTASKTGAAVPLRRCIGVSYDVEVCYVTRTYFTRHGAGPFPTECKKEEIDGGMTDLTNAPNPYQGTLRYGKMDSQEMLNRIALDISKWPETQRPSTHLYITQGNFMTKEAEKELIKAQYEFNSVDVLFKKELKWKK